MVQNHMLQLLSLIAMEPPATFDAEAVRDEKVKVLRAIRPIDVARVAEMAVRGQYVRGTARGKRVPAYADEPRVAEDTTTETYVARLEVDNWRWAGCPSPRTGKALRSRSPRSRSNAGPLLLFEHARIPATSRGRDRAQSPDAHPAREDLAPCGIEATGPASAWSRRASASRTGRPSA
jgi:glucose-6-phosphate 1-dehydrogenase